MEKSGLIFVKHAGIITKRVAIFSVTIISILLETQQEPAKLMEHGQHQ
jgi:hypothetical protein